MILVILNRSSYCGINLENILHFYSMHKTKNYCEWILQGNYASVLQIMSQSFSNWCKLLFFCITGLLFLDFYCILSVVQISQRVKCFSTPNKVHTFSLSLSLSLSLSVVYMCMILYSRQRKIALPVWRHACSFERTRVGHLGLFS